MAMRAVLDIGVNTTAFDGFLKRFQEFQASAGNTVVGGRGAPGSQQRRDEGFNEKVGFAERWANLTHRVKQDWDSMTEASSKVMRNVRDITSRILHVGSMMGLLTGLGTGFGFLGMDMLGRSASGMRRSAAGLGASTGASRAFSLDFGRFVDTNAVMGGVAEAMRDPQKRAALFGLGIRPAAGADTGDVAAETLRKVYELSQSTDEGMLGSALQAHQLDKLGFSVQDLTRLKHTSREEFESQMKHFSADRKGLNLTDATLRKWQDFTTAMERAGKKIETVFIEKLTPLTPALEKLATAFSNVITSFLSRKDLSEWIEKFAKGIENFAKWIGSADFKETFDAFLKKVKDIAGAIGDAVDWILSWLPSKHGMEHERGDKKPSDAAAAEGGHWGGPGNAWWVNPDGSYFDPKTGKTMTRPSSERDLAPGTEMGNWENKRLTSADAPPVPSRWGSQFSDNMKYAHDYFISQGWTEEQTKGILANLQAESGRSLNPGAENASGHQGIAQWDQTRRARFQAMFGHEVKAGTLQEQLAFLQWELTHTHKAAGDELRTRQTAAEATETVTRKVEVPGSGEALDREVRNRQAIAAGMQHASLNPPMVHVAIRNQTGGNAIITGNQGAVAAIG